MSAIRRGLAIVAIAAAGVLAACGGGDTAGGRPDASSSPVRFLSTGCVTADDAELTRYRDDDVLANVGIMGSGQAGVVISYEMGGQVCPWLPLADALVAAGYTVLLYDRLDGPEGAFVQPMVDVLRNRGVDRVGLVGGSIGGIVSITSASEVRPTPGVVVSVSGADNGTVADAPDLTMPLLIVVARGDTTFSVPAEATDAAATSSPGHTLFELPGTAHASLLFSVDKSVVGRIVDFVTKSMPAGSGG